MDAGLKKAAVMVVLRSGEALLLLQRNRSPNRGMYAPVGGHIEPHETPRQAAIREAREETGCTLGEVRFCGVVVETSPTDYNWILFVYASDVQRFELPACEEGELRWVDLARLAEFATPATDTHIYRLILAGQPFFLNAEYDAELNLLFLQDELTGQVFHGGAV